MRKTGINGRIPRRAPLTLAALGAAASTLVGCSVLGSGPLAALNPDFVQSLGGGTQVANVPGEAPVLLVELENATTQVVDMRLQYRDSTDQGIITLIETLQPGDLSGVTLVCPVEELTLGELGNPEGVGAFVRLGSQTTNDPFVSVEPFGVELQDQVNFDCGDVVTFRVQPSASTASGYQVFAFIRRAETGAGG